MKVIVLFYFAIFCIAQISGRSSTVNVHRGGARSASISVSGSVEKLGPVDTFVKTIKDARRHLAAAAVARATSIFAMYPVDTIKTRIQMEQPNPFRLAGIYSGVGGSLIGQVPYG